MNLLKALFTLAFVFTLCGVKAQETHLKKADHYFEKEAYFEAVEWYKKEYGRVNTPDEKAQMISRVADCYRLMLDDEQAEVWYRRSIKAKIDDRMVYYHLGTVLQAQAKYKDALEEYDKYIEKGGDKGMADKAIASCKRAEKKRKEPSRYVVEPELMLNSEFYDYGLSFSDKKNKSVIFASSRLGSTGIAEDLRVGESFQDLFKSTRDKKGKWSEPERVSFTVNTYNHEGAPTISADRENLYFTRCPVEEKSNDGCDIWVAPKAGPKWGNATMVELKPADQPLATVGHPSLSSDGKMLFFASDMKVAGSQGGRDLYVSQYDANAQKWGAPKNLGPAINTPGDEMFPFIRNNGELYFSSTSHDGLGGLDIYKAAKTGDAQWGNPENMGYPINTVYHDFGIVFDGDAERGFLSSDRAGGKGNDDIYYFKLPALEYALQCYVLDKVDNVPIVDATIKLVGSDGNSYEVQTDENGAYVFEEKGDERYINKGVNYSIEASAPDYLIAKDQVSTVNLDESTVFVKEFFLQPTDVEEIEFPEVQYDLGKYTLRPASMDSLNYLLTTLQDNPTIIIELAAHTDTRGSNPANQTLSENRAKSCVDYLVSKGIPRERMTAKGYGETRVRITDADIARMPTNEEKEAAHQKNRRTVFSVLSWDYVPK